MPSATYTNGAGTRDIGNLSNFAGNPGTASTGVLFTQVAGSPLAPIVDNTVGNHDWPSTITISGFSGSFACFNKINALGDVDTTAASLSRIDLNYAIASLVGNANDWHVALVEGAVIVQGTGDFYIAQVASSSVLGHDNSDSTSSSGRLYGVDNTTGVTSEDASSEVNFDGASATPYALFGLNWHGVISWMDATVNLLGSSLPSDTTFRKDGLTGGIKNFSQASGNPYTTISSGPTGSVGDLIGGFHTLAHGWSPTSVTVGGVAVTSFSCLLGTGIWSGIIAAGTPSGSQEVRVLKAADSIDSGAGFVTIAAASAGTYGTSLAIAGGSNGTYGPSLKGFYSVEQ